MTPALPDGTTWMNVPPPKKPPAELGGNGDPGTYEADAGYNPPGCWRTTEAGRAAQAALQAAIDALTDEQWERLGGRPDGDKQAAAIAGIRGRAAARRKRA